MKVIETVMLRSGVDRQRVLIPRAAVEDFARQAKERYMPVIFNHDPRVPPFGRTVDVRTRETGDGELEAIAISEIFEPGDELPLEAAEKKMALRAFKHGQLTVVADLSYRNPPDQEMLAEFEAETNAVVEHFEKKALEPLSVLTLGLVAGALTAFASGFLSKMGGDAWDFVKLKLARLLARRREEEREFLFILEVQLERDAGLLSVQCILTSPSPDDLERFWVDGMQELEHWLVRLVKLGPEVSQVVLHYQDQHVIPGFGVRSDCVPLKILRDTTGKRDDG